MPVDLAAIESILQHAWQEQRPALHEHEVYELVRASGAVRVPQTVYRPAGERFTAADLAACPGDRVVLKIVAPGLAHKSDAGGVQFLDHDVDQVNAAAEAFDGVAAHCGVPLAGAVLCEYMEMGAVSLGRELFVGIRASREFGPVIAAGLGGVHTEYLASVMQKGKAFATALTEGTTGAQMFAAFTRTMAYDILAGRARGYRRVIEDDILIECFDAFITVAHHFCDRRGPDQPLIAELEVNPFALQAGHLVPLDGLCHLKLASPVPPARPIDRVQRLLQPRHVAIVGVSASGVNMGRVILDNLLQCGFDASRLWVVKPGRDALDGVPCVPTIRALPEPVDTLVVAVSAEQVPAIVDEVITSGKAAAVILIPGGMGETEEGREVEEVLRRRITAARIARPEDGPVFLGGNCLGVQSRPGRFDTMFIPRTKLAKRWESPGRRAAVVSQSGAYVITRISNLETLDPDYAVSIGNQLDLTVSDVVKYLEANTDVEVFGIYVEGFRDLDGLEMARVVRRAVRRGKDVIFYKAGRTPAGQAATAAHTASIAGDYNVCAAALAASGALVADTFKEFEYLVQLASCLHGRVFSGCRVGGISNAGYEVVGMADSAEGPGYRVEFVPLGEPQRAELDTILQRYRLDRLVSIHNPLDLTPMAPDAAHEAVLRLMLASPDIDAVIASFVPLTPTMKTTPDEITDPDSLARRLPLIFAETCKPLVVAIDSGPLYDPLAHAIREAGIPVFRSADTAVRSLGRYLCHRTARQDAAQMS